MPTMLPCTVVRCGASTLLRCGACGTAAFCSLACAAEEWPEHRSGCFGPLAKRKDMSGDWLPAPEPIMAAEAPARSRLKGEDAEPAAEESAVSPHAGAGKAPVEEDTDPAKMCAYPPCDLPRIGFCTRCLLVGWCSVAHQKAHWKAGHKAACAPAETRLVPVLSWERRIMAEAKSAAPASLAARDKLAPIPGWDLIRDGAPPTAILKAWRKAAEGGHARAQCTLGVCYSSGTGVAQDNKVAIEWYVKAAARGYADAQHNLGVCYKRGLGVAQDYKLAVTWYAKAAAQGDADAQHNLGVCYASGKGVAQDYKLAVEWYAKAAAQGLASAQVNLGICYELGEGIAQDIKLAADWYGKAAAQGDAEASARRDACLARLAAAAGGPPAKRTAT